MTDGGSIAKRIDAHCRKGASRTVWIEVSHDSADIGGNFFSRSELVAILTNGEEVGEHLINVHHPTDPYQVWLRLHFMQVELGGWVFPKESLLLCLGVPNVTTD